MSKQEIGPREKQLRELREQKFARKPSISDLRKRVEKVKPAVKKQGGGRRR